MTTPQPSSASAAPAAIAGADAGAAEVPAVLRFGAFVLDVAGARLHHDGSAVLLRPKAFDLLVVLASRPGELVSKDRLLDLVWGRRFITEGVIKSIVAELRQALGDDPKAPRWIETVPRRGYRFAAALTGETVEPCGSSEPAPSPTIPLPCDPTPTEAGNLPLAQSALFGREEALDAVNALLAQHRLVTIAGPSGVGKTRLALALAALQRPHWRDGVWFIELAAQPGGARGVANTGDTGDSGGPGPTSDTAGLCAAVAQALRLDHRAGADLQALAQSLRPLQALLVLDNAEHLLQPLAHLVSSVLGAAPTLAILVTSQEPLRSADEQVYRLQPLALPASQDDADGRRLMDSSAVRLFAARAAARLQGFTLQPQQQQAVASICRALDGMPLAIELAAARVPLLGVNGIAELLLQGGTETGQDSRFDLLTGGARAAPTRQQSLHDALLWSYGLLDELQQATFRRLAVFRGGFTLAAAQRVCAGGALDGWAVADAVGALVDKSLVERVAGPTGLRFRLLESPRAFAQQRLDQAQEADATAEHHLQACLAHWAEADAAVLAQPGLVWTERQMPDIDNLRRALTWAHRQQRADALRALASASALLWCRSGQASEGRRWCELARALTTDDAPAAACAALDIATASLALYANAWPTADALAAARRAADALQTQDPLRAYFALFLAYHLQLRSPQGFDREAALQRMQALEQPQWSDLTKRFLRGARGYDWRLAGDTVRYLAFCRDEVRLCARSGAVAEGWTAAQGLMLAEHDSGAVDAAIAVGRSALAAIRAAGRIRQYGSFLALWVTLCVERSARGTAPAADDDDPRRLVLDAWPVLSSAGLPWMLHVAMAWLLLHEGRAADAARLLGWHHEAGRSSSVIAAGHTIGRSTKALSERLLQQLGSAAFDALQRAGQTLDQAAAEQLAVGAEPPLERRAQPR